MRKFLRILPAVVASTSLLVAGCATSRDEQTNTTGDVAESFAETVTFTNCDRELSFEAAPQRIVSMNGHVTEVLIDLGLADRIVGTAYADNEPDPEYAEVWASIPKLADEYPTMEQILDVEPDLVVGGMSSAFNEKEGRSRDAFAEHQIPTFLFTEYCGDTAFTIDAFTDDVTQLGQATGTEDAASDLIDEVTGELTAIHDAVADAPPVPTFVYDSGTDEPFTVGGVGVGQLIVESAGGENLFREGERPYATTSWETVAERAPEAIVVLDYGDETAQQKIDFLKGQPLMRTTPAVRDDRFVVVQLSDFFESPRLVGATRTVAEFLHPEAAL